MAKLTEYTEAVRFDSGDILIKDGNNGTRKIRVSNAASEFAGLISAANHRNTYRGKNLGTSITVDQRQAVSSGSFDDLFIGDYWTLNDRKYVIADMDYWYKTGGNDGGGTEPFNIHHLVMIPAHGDTANYMNGENVTTGGYIGSYFYTNLKAGYQYVIENDFGDMLQTHKEYFVNAVSNGYPSGAVWVDSKADLMNEIMVFGCPISQPSNTGAENMTLGTIDNQQLALFRLKPDFLARMGQGIWLRDVASATRFCSVSADGRASSNSASALRAILPAFAIQ